jgi:threonine aldolase
MSPIDGELGVFTGAQVRAGRHPRSRYMPPTRLVSVENTSNLGGGRVWSLAQVEDVSRAARGLGLATHMDGARLLNAVVASGTPARAYAALVDSLWIDFSKGLGAPVGACLAGSRAFIEEAWRYKQALGGAMRQAGIIAAGGVYALRHHVSRLAEDHDNAKAFARGIAGLRGIALDPAHVETNIVIFDVAGTGLTAQALADRLLATPANVRLSVMGEHRLRAVTHLDVSRKQIDAAVEAMAAVTACQTRAPRLASGGCPPPRSPPSSSPRSSSSPPRTPCWTCASAPPSSAVTSIARRPCPAGSSSCACPRW